VASITARLNLMKAIQMNKFSEATRGGVWYFAHPYTVRDEDGKRDYRGQEANFNMCVVRSAQLMIRGYNLYSPIAHSHPIQMACPDLQDDIWYRLDNEFIDVTDWEGIILAPGYEKSEGCVQERKRIAKRGLEVKYYDKIMMEPVIHAR